jgi:hypothetical protein
MRAILAQILETGDVHGHEQDGRVRLAVSVDAWLFYKLAALDADLAECEPEPDEDDDPPEDDEGAPLYFGGL